VSKENYYMESSLNLDNQTPQAPPANAAITIADLQNVLVVIDLASSRGAFRGAELQPVGQLFEKIENFVKTVAPQAAAQAAPAGAEPVAGQPLSGV